MMKTLAKGELRQVELSQQDGTGFLQLRHYHGVPGWHVLPFQRRAVGGANPGGVELVLHRHRNAVQRPQVAPGGNLPLRHCCCLSRLISAHGDVGVQPTVNPPDAFQVRFGGLDRRDISRLDEPPQLGHAEEGYFAALNVCHRDCSTG